MQIRQQAMKRPHFILTCAGCTLSSAAVLTVTPVQKVIQTLNDMKAKGAGELQSEQKVFQKYTEFVDDRTRELNNEIKTAEASIEELTAVASKADSDVASLGEQVKELDGEMDTLEGQKKSATDLRETEHAQFLQQQTDYEESLYALDRAIQTLEAQNYDRAQAMMLLQKMAKSVRGMHRVLAGLALVQEETHQTHDEWSPAVAAYVFQSSGIVDMLKTMRDRFQKELGEFEKEEMNKANACDMEVVHLTNTIAQMKAEREDAAAAKAENAALSARTKGELADTKVSLADAQKFLADLTSTFETKKATFQQNQQVRKDEIAALGKAIEILSSPEVADSYSEHVKFLQTRTSLLQTGLASRRIAAQGRALDYLQQKAKALKSANLAALVASMDANPFAKVIDMIKTLLEKLKEEAAQEADHKAWCDEELKRNKHKRSKKESDVARLTAEIEQKTVSIEKMSNAIGNLAAEQAELKRRCLKLRHKEQQRRRKMKQPSRMQRLDKLPSNRQLLF
jgi:peptidoglycan hydrolase CwlO-like protein